jgi:hypothetical protein
MIEVLKAWLDSGLQIDYIIPRYDTVVDPNLASVSLKLKVQH